MLPKMEHQGFLQSGYIAGLVAVLTFLASPAEAVIRVDIPLSQVLGLSKRLLIGKVAVIDAKAQCVEVALEKDAKREIAAQADAQRAAGHETRQVSKFRPKDPRPVDPAVLKQMLEKYPPQPLDKTVKVDLAAVPDVLKQVKVGDPVVLLAGRVKGGAVHIADGLNDVEETPQGNPPTWKITKKSGMWWAFPGYTRDLVECFNDLSTGKTRVDQVGANPGVHALWPYYKEIASVKGKATFIVAATGADVNIEPHSLHWDELIFATEDGKIYLADNLGLGGDVSELFQWGDEKANFAKRK